MRDDAGRPDPEVRGLHRGAAEHGRGGWFREQDNYREKDDHWERDDVRDPAGPGNTAPEPGQPAGATNPQQRYAQALTAMNEIVATKDFTALPWVAEVFRTTAFNTHEDDPARAGVLNNVGSAAQLAYRRSGDLQDLENAVSHYRAANRTARPDDEDAVLYACNLALALTDHANAGKDPHVAGEAVHEARAAVERAPEDDPRRVVALVRLGNALKTHGKLTGEVSSDNPCVEVFREAVRSVASGGTEVVPASEMLIDLGGALLHRYEHSTGPEDLDEGITHLRSGVDRMADGNARRTALCDLANALRLRFQHNGHLSDLNTAIGELLGVLGVLESGDPLLGTTLWNLAVTTVEHVDSTGEPSQLRRVLRTFAGATRGLSREDPDNTAALAGYSGLLRRHFLHGAAPNALDTAVAAGEAALETAESTERSTVLNSLASTLITRYEHSGYADDLERAAELAERAGELAPESSPAQHSSWAALGILAGYRYRLNGRGADLDSAVEMLDRALTAMPPTAPGRAAVATRLGRTLQMQFHKTGRRRVYRWAQRVLTEGATQETAPAEQRLRAANICGRLAAGAHRWAEALDSFTTAVELLPLVTRGRGVVGSAQEHRRWAWLTADAAACAVETGEPQRAVELLEHGRNTLLADFLPVGGDLEDLRRELPDLVDEAVRLRRLLDRPPEETSSTYEEGGRARLAEAWTALLDEAGTAAGGNPMRAAGFDQLAPAAEEGAVVLVNLSRYRSDALIVFAERVVTIPLPGATPEVAGEQAQHALVAARRGDAHGLSEALDWTWRHITNPVLTRMGYTRTPEIGQRWPRLWWASVGPHAFLPLHAATARTGESALDRVISSYTPGMRALARAQRRRGGTGGRALVAGSAERVARELPRQNQVLAKYWAGADVAATEDTASGDVLRQLADHPWLHVCEPSTQNPDYPAAGLVVDRDQPSESLSLVEVGQTALHEAEFGYLARCASVDETPSAAALPLGTALAFAGYRHTVSTLWGVDAETGSQVHAETFDELFGSPEWDPDRAAAALHQAAQRIRAHSPGEPEKWAGHIHVGP